MSSISELNFLSVFILKLSFIGEMCVGIIVFFIDKLATIWIVLVENHSNKW